MQETPVLSYKHRSFSQVKQLRTCGYQFYLERILRAPSRPSVPAVAGVATHSATELIDHYLTRDAVSLPSRKFMHKRALKAALTALDAEILARHESGGWEEEDYKVFGFRPRMTFEWYRTVGIPNTITAYLDWRLLNPQFELAEIPGFGPAVELPFNYYIEDQLIHGSIDRVFMVDGRPVVVDLKSGKPPATDEQLGLYGAALNKALGWHVEYGFYLHNLRKGEAKLTPPLHLSHWNDATLGQVYLPATKLIDLGIYIPAPGDACEFCAVSESCPFAESVV